MLKRDWSVVSIDDVAWLFAQFCDPHCKLSWIANGGREEDVLDIGWQHDDGLLPHDASFLVPHVVYFVENHPLHLTHDLAASVYHVPQNLSSHHQAGSVLLDGDVASHQSHVNELLLQLTVLLVGQSLDG